ncbi:MAG: enoyl-CoA hydratase/isomerase family protein [Desulfobacterales bacterium]|nr:MAG: enoyl-CoA hydratase/isomerase family protein [Desulfobacterales bacterium]
MNCKYLQVRIEDRVGWLEYEHPPINTFNWEMLREVPAALQALLDEPQVRVVVFASALEKYFSVGADLSVFDGIGMQGMAEWVSICHGLVNKMRRSRKPLLAAIHGTAAGGGLEMVLHCDIRFAAADARLGQPEIKIGFIPPVGTTQALARLLGRSRAIRYLYEGTLVSADEALSMGLIDIICPPERLREEVRDYAVMLSQRPAEALAAIRRTITEGGAMSFDEGLKMEYESAVNLAGTEDFSEGIRAFLEKRKARWQ